MASRILTNFSRSVSRLLCDPKTLRSVATRTYASSSVNVLERTLFPLNCRKELHSSTSLLATTDAAKKAASPPVKPTVKGSRGRIVAVIGAVVDVQ
ncbi:unnamed protein product, partial [Wuchereria bancrofti]